MWRFLAWVEALAIVLLFGAMLGSGSSSGAVKQPCPSAAQCTARAQGSAALATLTFEPTAVTIHAIRLLPLGWRFGDLPEAWGGSATVWLRSKTPRKSLAQLYVKKKLEWARSLASGGNGGSLLLTLDPAPQPLVGQTLATIIRASNMSTSWSDGRFAPVGTYTGNLALTPTGDKAPTVAVTVKVEDFILWPILAIFLGALVAWRFIKSWDDVRRPREVAFQELKQAAADYRSAAQGMAVIPYRLDAVFPADDRWQCPPGTGAPRAVQVYCRVALAGSTQDLDAAQTDVADIRQVVQLWPKVCDAAGSLQQSLEDLEKKLNSSPISIDNFAIIAKTTTILAVHDPPSDAAGTQSLLDLMRQQANAIQIWGTVYTSYGNLKSLYAILLTRQDAMSEVDRQRLQENNPEEPFFSFAQSAETLGDLTNNKYAARLWDIAGVLRLLDQTYPRRSPFEAYGVGVSPAPAAPALGVPFSIAPIPVTLSDERSAAAILASIQQHDLLEFFLVFAITVGVYVLTIYPNATFGTISQYAGAFLAGAGGQLVINWKLLPWYRGNAGAAAPS